MKQFLRALLTGSPAPKKTPGKTLGLSLSSIKGSLVEDHNLPRPQWKIIREWIREKVPANDHEQAWREIVAEWLNLLIDRLAGRYQVTSSPNFLVLTSRDRDSARVIHQACEITIQQLGAWLGPAAAKRGFGKHLILDFATIEQYYDYIAYYYPPESHTKASGGIFLNYGYAHIALPPQNRTQSTLIHELTHNCLTYLTLPLWVEEGIAVTMERKIGGDKSGMLNRELRQKHASYWTSETIAEFWTGASFRNPNGEISHLSYSLGEILVDLMVQEFPNFMDFVAEAKHQDAGESAARKCFDHGLNEIASTFLGPGKWFVPLPENQAGK